MAIQTEELPPNPLPCDYDSEKGKLISDNDFQSEEEIEEEKPNLYPLPPRRSSSSDSSSDESGKKPGRQKRNLMKFDKKVDSVRTELKAEIEAVNDNLENLEAKIVSIDDSLGNFEKMVELSTKAMKSVRTEH